MGKKKGDQKKRKGDKNILPIAAVELSTEGSENALQSDVQSANQTSGQSEEANKPPKKFWDFFKKLPTSDKIQAIAAAVNGVVAIAAIVTLIYSQKALKLTRKTIEATEISNLQIQDLKLDNDTLYYSISNLGVYPIKIIRASVKFSIKGSVARDIRAFQYTDFSKLYIVKEYPLKRNIVKNNFWATEGEAPVYFEGWIEFVNEVTMKPRIYVFEILIPSNPGDNFEFIDNVND